MKLDNLPTEVRLFNDWSPLFKTDPNFSRKEFERGATQAAIFVSDLIASQNWSELEELDVVSPHVIREVRQNIAKWSDRLIPNIRVREENIFFPVSFFHTYRTKDPEESGEDYKEFRLFFTFMYRPGSKAPSMLQFINPLADEYRASYLFRRKYVNGKPQSQWIVDGLNHFIEIQGLKTFISKD